jgi:hypothetical protein
MRLALWLALTLTLASATVHAQTRPDDPLSPLRIDPLQLDRAYKHAQARRNIGIGLAAPGVALTILGAVLLGYGGQNQNLFGAGEEIAGGSVAAGIGLALSIPGVILWILGQDDMDVASWRKKQLLGAPFTF